MDVFFFFYLCTPDFQNVPELNFLGYKLKYSESNSISVNTVQMQRNW